MKKHVAGEDVAGGKEDDMCDRAIEPGRESVYEVVWPLGKSAAAPAVDPTPPIVDLNGKTVGELWDWLFKGPEIFSIVRQRLKERFPTVKFVDYSTFGNIHGSNEAEVIASLPEALRQHGCDAVISAVGA
ncbi:MAG: hypothetical protein HYX94_04405 [Chloroflexi bacterium]|nr:hypothetical protein [Chloroflexota bacterium]